MPVSWPAKPDTLGKLPVRLLRLRLPTLPRAPVRLLAADVANCEALPRLFMADCTEARLGVIPEVNDPRLGKDDKLGKDPMPVMLVRLLVRLLIDGKPWAHCAVRGVPNLLALATKLPT